jgi:hypothetical protein
MLLIYEGILTVPPIRSQAGPSRDASTGQNDDSLVLGVINSHHLVINTAESFLVLAVKRDTHTRETHV